MLHLLIIVNNYFDGTVNQIYLSERQLNKANSSDIEAQFRKFHLNISDGFVLYKIYDKRDDFDFDYAEVEIFFVQHLTGFIYLSSFGLPEYLHCSYVTDFDTRNKILTAKLLKQGYRYHKLCKTFSNFYRRHFDLLLTCYVGHKSILSKACWNLNFMVVTYGV